MKKLRAVSATTIFLVLFFGLMVLSPILDNEESAQQWEEFVQWGAISEFAEVDDDEFTLESVASAEGERMEADHAYLAIIIDDLGSTRIGVDEVMAIDRPLTLAVMPFLEYSKEDAERGHAAGHEIILHMPMEAKAGMGVQKSWLGPRPIMNSHSDEEIREIYNDSLDDIPHAIGANIHIGSLVSENERIMTLIMEETQKRGLLFIDSRTAAQSACRLAASNIGVPFAERDVFLERAGEQSANYAKEQLNKAARLAKETGSAIAIGHVGMEGGTTTARAIREMIPVLEAQGIEFVSVSKLIGME